MIATKVQYYKCENLSLWFSHDKQYEKIINLKTLTSSFFSFTTFTHQVKLKQNSWFTPRKKGPITLSRHPPLPPHYTKLCYYFMSQTLKKERTHNEAMHHFYTITPIILLFHESCPKTMGNHTITPTAGGASLKYCGFHKAIDNLRKVC